MLFSLIIPVYNRSEEVDELLESLSLLDYNDDFEIVIIEDGSSLKCEDVVHKYDGKLSISYYYKDNSGPGDSRNYGMKMAKGDYFIIFDSDIVYPHCQSRKKLAISIFRYPNLSIKVPGVVIQGSVT